MQSNANPDKYVISPQGLLNAEVDGSEGITNLDATYISKFALGLITKFPVES